MAKVAQKDSSEIPSSSLSEVKRGLRSALSSLKRGFEEKVMYDFRVRDPVMIVGGLGAFALGLRDTNILVQTFWFAGGSSVFTVGTMDLGFEIGAV